MPTLNYIQKAQFFFTIWICKICSVVGKWIFKRGSSAPGALALRFCPWILAELSRRFKGETIVVCGTNGKTTTNNLLYTLLKAKGRNVFCNNAGANMLTGIVTTYIDGCGVFGEFKADYACLEIDEASAVKVFDSLKPDYMIITNFFRDQLDRYGEIDLTMDWLKKAVEKTPDTILFLNGDDPLCGGFERETERKRVFFGIDEQTDAAVIADRIDAADIADQTNAADIADPADTKPQGAKECRFCVFCGQELKYHYYHYSQLGDYYCEHCGFCRPALDCRATEVKLEEYLEFMALNQNIRVNLKGFHNIYNILAAVSVVSFLGISLDNVNDILSEYKPQFGRMEGFTVRGVPVILNLSKNPAGFNQAVSDMRRDPRSKNVVIVIHDNPQDGTDISWLWDVDFEELTGADFSCFAASGIRAEDLFLRMKYAGIAPENILFEKDIKAALKAMLREKNEVLYVLTNYTPLLETRKILLKLGKE